MSKSSKLVIVILNSLVLFYTASYLIDLFNSKIIEGYELALSALVFDFICVPFLIYYYFKNQILAIKYLVRMMISYTLCSLIGIKISIILIFIISIFFLYNSYSKKI
jgi:hypothetical protein